MTTTVFARCSPIPARRAAVPPSRRRPRGLFDRLRSGIDVKTITSQLRESMPVHNQTEGDEMHSCPDAIARVIEKVATNGFHEGGASFVTLASGYQSATTQTRCPDARLAPECSAKVGA